MNFLYLLLLLKVHVFMFLSSQAQVQQLSLNLKNNSNNVDLQENNLFSPLLSASNEVFADCGCRLHERGAFEA